MFREVREQAPTRPAGTDLGCARRPEVAVEQSAGCRAQRRDSRESVQHRNVLEDPRHTRTAALSEACGQYALQACGLCRRVARTHKAPRYFLASASQRVVVERIASEEVDLLDAIEKPGAGLAASDSLQLRDGQVLDAIDPVREEDALAVVMSGDEEDVALHPPMAGRREPIRPSPFDEFDEPEAIGRQCPLERLRLVRRVDRDRAHRTELGTTLCRERKCETRCDGEELCNREHDTVGRRSLRRHRSALGRQGKHSAATVAAGRRGGSGDARSDHPVRTRVREATTPGAGRSAASARYRGGRG